MWRTDLDRQGTGGPVGRLTGLAHPARESEGYGVQELEVLV